MAQLELGQLVMTQGVAIRARDESGFAVHVIRSLQRYLRCDWGEMDDEDKAMNDSAIGPDEDRVFAAYEHPEHPENKLYIITERDRSSTTILFPDEY
jgi:hypothetical protein